MKTAIIGTNGLLGGAFQRHCLALGLRESVDLLSLDLPDFDVTSRLFSLDTLCDFHPDVIVNLAGIQMIDWLEKKPNTARTVHVQGTANMREAAKRTDALLVHLSCAEVFGQTADVVADYPPFCETDVPEPVSVYAKTKLDSERAASESPRHLIVRTGMLFGHVGKRSSGNIVETLLNALRRPEKVRVIDDWQMSPTWSDDLAHAVFSLIECGATGLYHVANSGVATPFEIAREIVRLTGVKREFAPISFAEYGSVAPRAKYTVLDTSKYDALSDTPKLPAWQQALEAYLASRSSFLH
ncbi:MAG: NAD(P)-dependent oxidoreductase [Planctomycetaceae bacterium]|nr:NAD(P)-dependent oxidoreductase [Planctomycetaceae bacterium]